MFSGLRQFQNARYTGERRCTPCTLVNMAIAIGVASVIFRVSLLIAMLWLVVSLVLIWSRGYLVPGTPWLTKRFLPISVLELFRNQPWQELEDPNNSGSLEEILLEADVVEENGGDPRLTDEVARRWRNELNDTTSVTQIDFGPIVGVPDPDIIETGPGNIITLEYEAVIVDQWPSEAALLADGTGEIVLSSHNAREKEGESKIPRRMSRPAVQRMTSSVLCLYGEELLRQPVET